MEFLWPILAKIELICQQTQVSGVNPSSGVPERMTGGWWGGLAMLTIEQMLLECTVWQQTRDEYYTAESLRTLFETIPEACIVEFLREAGFFYIIWKAIYSVQHIIRITHQLKKFGLDFTFAVVESQAVLLCHLHQVDEVLVMFLFYSAKNHHVVGDVDHALVALVICCLRLWGSSETMNTLLSSANNLSL